MKKWKFLLIAISIAIALSNAFVIPFLYFNSLLIVNSQFAWKTYALWEVYWFVMFMLLINIILSHKFAEGKKQEWLFLISIMLVVSNLLAYVVYTLYVSKWKLQGTDWIGSLTRLLEFDWRFYGIMAIFFIGLMLLYLTVLDRKMFKAIFGNASLSGNGKLKSIESNLENSRWMTKEEAKKTFKPITYSKLKDSKKDGVPVQASLTRNDKDLDILFNSPCHSIIIGSTGSGKTTTFVNPMVQILGASSAGSSMILTDPKGELFSMHSKFLVSRGYDVKVIDLRDTYSSYRWNPLDAIYDAYQKYATAQDNVFLRRDSVSEAGLQLAEPEANFEGIDKWYEFEGKAYATYSKLVTAIKLYKKKTYDEIYEDLNDLVSVLIPVENDKDPMWEKGARAITLATLLAMLEDSEDERLGLTKEKFNFFNLTKILQNSNNDYLELRRYFTGRSALSKASSLSKQVCDAAESTRASYMSIVYEKLTLFNDTGICALTSGADFVPRMLSDKPTALFLKIPDEKDTRHNLAAICILDIYKSLIKVASSFEDLSLPRNVYFILDEFGNMPKIEKFDKMITVGRSRKIWFNMIIQSYAQLNNVYGDTVADIVKGNCGIKMFIGSNDINTCKEYSELCGNITVVTRSTSGTEYSSDSTINVTSSTQVRPLIYPSELQRLNKPGDIGHSIVVTFGNYPFKTYFSPSFKVPFYQFAKMDTSELSERFFDEKAVFFDCTIRNKIVEDDESGVNQESTSGGQEEVNTEEAHQRVNEMIEAMRQSNIVDSEPTVDDSDSSFDDEIVFDEQDEPSEIEESIEQPDEQDVQVDEPDTQLEEVTLLDGLTPEEERVFDLMGSADYTNEVADGLAELSSNEVESSTETDDVVKETNNNEKEVEETENDIKTIAKEETPSQSSDEGMDENDLDDPFDLIGEFISLKKNNDNN